ncbi:MAG: DUF116 domain-containing protein [Euryarchaeota archaeon]|nr:DUF116 domain-containing protein [Euryarchaeota archaeon]
MFYELIGKLSIVLFVGFVSLLVTSIILGLVLLKKKRLILPRLLLFTMDSFYLQVKGVARMFGLSDRIVDQMGIEVRNSLSQERFSRVEPQDRILVVPQCLRHIKCPARLDSAVGVTCKECGLCIIKDLKKEAERLGYGFYIVPGGSFVERIVQRVRPKAALGVACHKDLNMAMHGLSRGKCIVQGVSLTKDGCIQTEVNFQELLRKMGPGLRP